MKYQCPICGHKLLAASRLVEYFDVDKEPYVDGVKQEGEVMKGEFQGVEGEGVMVSIQYCEKCDKIIKRWV